MQPKRISRKKLEPDYLVLDGEFFEVEFYYTDADEIVIWDDFKKLSENEKTTFFLRVEKLANSAHGTIHPKTIFNLEDAEEKIWAIKFGNNRFCSFFFEGGKIIITNAYKKQSQSNRKKETAQIKKAAKMKADYTKRTQEKAYYRESEE